MKMSNTYCCARCFEDIAKKNTCAARLWLEICDVIFQGEVLRTVSSGESVFDEHLRVLEEMQYVLTTDQADVVCIKLSNFDPLNPKYPFCRGRHDEENVQ
jgi:hypothetical protein